MNEIKIKLAKEEKRSSSRKLPELDPFEGFDPIAVLLARKIAWMKRLTDSSI